MKKLFLFFVISFLGAGAFCQVQDSLMTERNNRIEALYRTYLKKQRREDRGMILIGLAATTLGVLILKSYDPLDPDLDGEDSRFAWTGVGLSIGGAIVLGYGLYSLPGEGSAKKKRTFFMKYERYDFGNGILPRPGLPACGVIMEL